MIFLFQNIISLVSCQHICAPNHVQVQLSVRLINVWMCSDYIQPGIHNTINSWDYMGFLWIKWTTKSALCNPVLLKRVYYAILRYWYNIKRIYLFLNKVGLHDQNFYQYNKNIIDILFLCLFPNVSLSSLWLRNHSQTCHQQDGFILNESFIYVWIQKSKIYQISEIWTKIRAYNLKRFVTSCF